MFQSCLSCPSSLSHVVVMSSSFSSHESGKVPALNVSGVKVLWCQCKRLLWQELALTYAFWLFVQEFFLCERLFGVKGFMGKSLFGVQVSGVKSSLP